MPDQNRLGKPGEKNKNEAMDEDGSTQGVAPGTGSAAEGGIVVGGATATNVGSAGETGDTSGTGR